jgi:polysaccharide biosynthesis/export protein
VTKLAKLGLKSVNATETSVGSNLMVRGNKKHLGTAAILLVAFIPGTAPTQDVGGAGASVVLPAEVVGPNDLIEIMVPYCTELSRSFRVDSDGDLTLPLLKGSIKVAGLRPPQIAKEIEEALTQQKVMNDPIVTASVIEYRSRPVNVIGAVNHPLTFQATGETTLLDAITRAGGFSPNVGTNVLVTTKNRRTQAKTESIVQVIPVRNLTSSADPGYNIELRGGEEIRVPEANKIFVAGNVNRPGAYTMQGDADTTVIKALALSAGLAPYAAKEAYIYRLHPGGGGRDELKVPLNRIMKRKAPDTALRADDILYIPDNNGKRMTSKVLNEIAGVGAAVSTGLVIYH